MTLLASELKKIHEEDIAANGSVSEGFFKKLASAVNYVIDNFLWDLGDVRSSLLTEAQFAARNGYSLALPEAQRRWVLMKGQSIAGSALNNLTGIEALQNMVANGAHLEQATGALNQYLISQNKAHTHGTRMGYPDFAGGGIAGSNDLSYVWTGATNSEGGSVARPNSVTVNFFIKINN